MSLMQKMQKIKERAPILHLVSAGLIMAMTAWFAVCIAIEAYNPPKPSPGLIALAQMTPAPTSLPLPANSPYYYDYQAELELIAGAQGVMAGEEELQPLAIEYSYDAFQWRCLAAACGIAACYYSARHPSSKSHAFFAFAATSLAAMSWIALSALHDVQWVADNQSLCHDLKVDFAAVAAGATSLHIDIGTISNVKIWCTLSEASIILSVIQEINMFLLAVWAFVKLLLANGPLEMHPIEHATHIVTWLAIAGYGCWMGGVVQLVTTEAYSNSTELFNQFDYPALVITPIFAVAMSAFVSFGSSHGHRINAALFNAFSLFVVVISMIWFTRVLWQLGQCSTDRYNSKYWCPTKWAVSAGMGSVAGCNLVLLFLHLLHTRLPESVPVNGDGNDQTPYQTEKIIPDDGGYQGGYGDGNTHIGNYYDHNGDNREPVDNNLVVPLPAETNYDDGSV